MAVVEHRERFVMRRLQLLDHASGGRRAYPRRALAKYLSLCLAVVFGVCAVAQVSSAQSPKQEAEEPLTAEDIAESVKAVNALKQDKAKVKVYCSVVDMLDGAEEDDKATGKAAAKKPVDPKAEEALDAKVEKIIGSLGEDFSDAYYTMADLPEKSPIGKPLIAAFEELDKSCDSQGQ